MEIKTTFEKELNLLYEKYLINDDLDIDEIEKILLQLLEIEKNNVDYIIQYVLVLLHEPILDYEKALLYLENINDIRAVLIRSYIQDWYFGKPPELGIKEINKYINQKHSKAELSALYYFTSLSVEDVDDKIHFLKKSLAIYQYNFLNVIELIKLSKNKKDLKLESLFIDNVRFNRCISKTSYLYKRLVYKPFLYNRLLGIGREEDNISILKQILFNN